MADNNNNQKPWWAPDAQGFLAASIVTVCAIALFIRMFRTSQVDDKMLDTMITILFSTCLVTVYNYSFGSSRGATDKDATQNKIVEKLTNGGSNTAPIIILTWWGLLTDAEKTAITAAASSDSRVQDFVTASATGKATINDLTYLVNKGLLTQDRANAIAATKG